LARLQSLGLLLAMGLAACTVSPAPLGSHLPGAFNEASDAFDRRVQQRFAIGSDERELRGALANERSRSREIRCIPLLSARGSPRMNGCVERIGTSLERVCRQHRDDQRQVFRDLLVDTASRPNPSGTNVQAWHEGAIETCTAAVTSLKAQRIGL